MENGLNPACRVLTKLGGEVAVHKGTGIPIDTLWRWQRSKERGGTGGRIPQERWPVLHEYAATVGTSLHSLELLGEEGLLSELQPTG